MKNKRKKIVFAVLSVVLLAAIAAGGVNFIRKKEKAGMQDAAYFTQAVQKGNIREAISSTGRVNPLESYSVWPQSGIEGAVLSSDFEIGSKVKKGDILYRISAEAVETKIKTAEQNLKLKKKTLSRALKNNEETTKKFANYTAAAGQDGYIKSIEIHKGDTIQTGSSIAKLFNNKKMNLVIPFAADSVSDKTIGKTAKITLSLSGERIKGKVTKVNDYTDNLSGTRVVRYVTVEVLNPGGIAANDRASADIGDLRCSEEGVFLPVSEGNILSAINGEVEDVLVKEGEWVKAGDMVLRIKKDSYDVQLNAAKEQIETAQMAVTEAETELKTLKQSKKEYQIISPIDGVIVKKTVKQGDILNTTTSKEALCVIYDLSAMIYSMMIDETDVGKLKEGQEVSLTAEALPEQKFKGKITNISMEASVNDGGVTQYPVTVRVKNFGAMRPGMNVTGEIVVNEVKNALIIPSDALVRGNIVYLEDKTAGKTEDEVPAGFRIQEVRVGISDGNYIEVTQGLSEGQKVYVAQKQEGMENMEDLYGDEF